MSLALIAAVSLFWNANHEPDLYGYFVYQGGMSDTYTNRHFVGGITNCRVEGLVAGVSYYFAVTAVNASGWESYFSNETEEIEQWNVDIALCPPNGVTLAFETFANQSYVIESAPSLDLSWFGWTDAVMVAGTGSKVEVSVPMEAAMSFFRVRSL